MKHAQFQSVNSVKSTETTSNHCKSTLMKAQGWRPVLSLCAHFLKLRLSKLIRNHLTLRISVVVLAAGENVRAIHFVVCYVEANVEANFLIFLGMWSSEAHVQRVKTPRSRCSAMEIHKSQSFAKHVNSPWLNPDSVGCSTPTAWPIYQVLLTNYRWISIRKRKCIRNFLGTKVPHILQNDILLALYCITFFCWGNKHFGDLIQQLIDRSKQSKNSDSISRPAYQKNEFDLKDAHFPDAPNGIAV